MLAEAQSSTAVSVDEDTLGLTTGKNHVVKRLLSFISGSLAGIVFVVVTGALSIQVIGNKAGVAFDLRNEVAGIVAPRLPILPSLAVAALSGMIIALYSFTLRRGDERVRRAVVISFAAVVALLVIYSYFLTAGRIDGGDAPQGVLRGWRGWLEEGGGNPAVHVVALLSVMSLWLKSDYRTQAVRSQEDHRHRTALTKS